MLKQRNEICGTDRLDGGCNYQLVVIDREIDPNSLILRLFDRQNTVSSSYLSQSADGNRQYLNLETYLEQIPAGQLLNTTPPEPSLDTTPDSQLLEIKPTNPLPENP
ncbi:MAG: hypothetical protein HC916_17920 [Coleofasciculaceae cyanobacterium SM2_1_6]|nr:hypothetical protein [Coleofasciculaceae cyanobacterium SM2_1_6]